LAAAVLAAKILYDRTDDSTDPLGPKKPLIYMTGPFVGTPVPFSGRHHVTAKSPLTGIFGDQMLVDDGELR
jgi:aldehyde:ferredoxin oxidoreductase